MHTVYCWLQTWTCCPHCGISNSVIDCSINIVCNYHQCVITMIPKIELLYIRCWTPIQFWNYIFCIYKQCNTLVRAWFFWEKNFNKTTTHPLFIITEQRTTQQVDCLEYMMLYNGWNWDFHVDLMYYNTLYLIVYEQSSHEKHPTTSKEKELELFKEYYYY